MGTVTLGGSNVKPKQDFLNKRITLLGSQNSVINGSGAILHTVGSGNTTVNGNLHSLSQTGSGNSTIHGNVVGHVRNTGAGKIKVDGYINGTILQIGRGVLHIGGDVYGDIFQVGSGAIRIEGNVKGKVLNVGSGKISICGAVNKNKPQVDIGTVKVNDTTRSNIFYGKRISQVGLGNIFTGGTWYRNVKKQIIVSGEYCVSAKNCIMSKLKYVKNITCSQNSYLQLINPQLPYIKRRGMVIAK